MEPAPLFSIVLPTYNRAPMLRSALKSVLAQTFAGYECFVLDDGSTDATPRVFEEFNGRPRLRLFRFDDNRRQHARRNFAIARARGEFIAFLDSDDLWLPRRLEAFAEAIRAKPETGFWFSNAYLLRYGRVIGTVFNPAAPIEEGQVPGWRAVGGLPYLTSNLAVRRETFARIGPFREDMKILEDTELYARMLASGVSVGAIRAPLAVRRLHPEQITHDHRIDFQESLLALKAGGLPAERLPIERERLAFETAEYLWRSLDPRGAREFLVRETGAKGRGSWLYKKTFVPAGILRLLRETRRLSLIARHHPLWAPAEIKDVYRVIAPWLAQEKSSARGS